MMFQRLHRSLSNVGAFHFGSFYISICILRLLQYLCNLLRLFESKIKSPCRTCVKHVVNHHQNYVSAKGAPIANAVSALPFTAELIVKPGQMLL